MLGAELLSTANLTMRIAITAEDVARVSEPGALALLGAGILGLMVARRRLKAPPAR